MSKIKMSQIPFELLKKVLIDYRSYRNNSISPYFALEFDNFLKYFFDFSKVEFIINTFNNKPLKKAFILLSEQYPKEFQNFYGKSLSLIILNSLEVVKIKLKKK